MVGRGSPVLVAHGALRSGWWMVGRGSPVLVAHGALRSGWWMVGRGSPVLVAHGALRSGWWMVGRGSPVLVAHGALPSRRAGRRTGSPVLIAHGATPLLRAANYSAVKESPYAEFAKPFSPDPIASGSSGHISVLAASCSRMLACSARNPLYDSRPAGGVRLRRGRHPVLAHRGSGFAVNVRSSRLLLPARRS